MLSPDERERVSRFSRPDRGVGYARRRAALRMLLAWLLGGSARSLKIISDGRGQPAIAGLPLRLACDSLDDRLVVGLTTRSRLGICLHAVAPMAGDEVDRVFANHELRQLRQQAASDRPAALTRMFARKDAARRLAGQPPSGAADNVWVGPSADGRAVATVPGEPPIGVVDLQFGDVAVGAVAAELAACDVQTWSVDYGMISAWTSGSAGDSESRCALTSRQDRVASR